MCKYPQVLLEQRVLQLLGMVAKQCREIMWPNFFFFFFFIVESSFYFLFYFIFYSISSTPLSCSLVFSSFHFFFWEAIVHYSFHFDLHLLWTCGGHCDGVVS